MDNQHYRWEERKSSHNNVTSWDYFHSKISITFAFYLTSTFTSLKHVYPVNTLHTATFLPHHLLMRCSFPTPHRGKNSGWWCITAAVWLWTSTESFHSTGSSTRGTTSPPSGQRELQPSTGGMTPWSCNSTRARPPLTCPWGTTLLCCHIVHIYNVWTHKLTQAESVINSHTGLYSS